MKKIIVDGEPVGKERPRFVRSTGVAYTPKKTKDYEKAVKEAWIEQKGPFFVDSDVCVKIIVKAYMRVPKSVSKKRHDEMLTERPTKKPDASNILKAVEDGLIGVAYADDDQICAAICEKYWSDEPRVEITVEALTEEEMVKGVRYGE